MYRGRVTAFTIAGLILISSLGVLITTNIQAQPHLVENRYFDLLDNAFDLTHEETELLDVNGFIVLNRMGTDDILDAYAYYWNNDLPVFITTDTMLQMWHLIFDKILTKLESEILLPLLSDFVTSILQQLESRMSEDHSLALNHTLIYMLTAVKLLDADYAVSDEYQGWIDELITAITEEITIFDAAALFTDQPLSRFIDDFSQYKPRGHYAESEQLKTYFRIFKWLSRIPFLFDTYYGFSYLKTEPLDMLQSAIELTYAMKTSLVSTPNYEGSGLQIWQFFEDFLNSLIGKTFYVSPAFLDQFLLDTIGDWHPSDLPSSTLVSVQEQLLNHPDVQPPMDPEMVDALVAECAASLDYGNPSCSPPSFHLLGERLGLDAFSLNHYVFPYTSHYFPNGLQFAATLLNSDRAEAYLTTSNRNDLEEIAAVKNENQDWLDANTDTISTSWFESLSELTTTQPSKEGSYPDFMNYGSWQDEKLTTVLGSWAQYRHDTILYGKISFTSIGCATPEAYVEPYPQFFRQLQQTSNLYADTLGRLQNIGYNLSNWKYYAVTSTYPNGTEHRYYFDSTPFDVIHDFNYILEQLALAADYQLNGQPLPDDLLDYLKTIYREDRYDGHLWGWLSDLFAKLTTGTTGGDYWNRFPDSRASTVADIHTDLNSRRNLLVATGYLEHLIAKVPAANGTMILAAGPVFSYYEFLTPMDIRMTDEEWRGILTSYTPDSPYDYSIIPRGFWAQNYMVSTDITQGHIYEDESFAVPDWFETSDNVDILSNYGDVLDVHLPDDITLTTSTKPATIPLGFTMIPISILLPIIHRKKN